MIVNERDLIAVENTYERVLRDVAAAITRVLSEAASTAGADMMAALQAVAVCTTIPIERGDVIAGRMLFLPETAYKAIVDACGYMHRNLGVDVIDLRLSQLAAERIASLIAPERFAESVK